MSLDPAIALPSLPLKPQESSADKVEHGGGPGKSCRGATDVCRAGSAAPGAPGACFELWRAWASGASRLHSKAPGAGFICDTVKASYMFQTSHRIDVQMLPKLTTPNWGVLTTEIVANIIFAINKASNSANSPGSCVTEHLSSSPCVIFQVWCRTVERTLALTLGILRSNPISAFYSWATLSQ